MKRKSLFTICTAAAVALSSCTGMLMSTDFGIDDYGPANNWYWSPYNSYYPGPGAWMGPSWGTPPPPPRPVPVRPAPSKPSPVQPPSNGANRPNISPSRPSQSPTNPPASQRPGNMGQAPSEGNVQRPGNSGMTPSQNSHSTTNTNGSSATHRGR